MKVERAERARNETQDLTKPIRVALNRMPGVRVARNNTGALRWAPQGQMVTDKSPMLRYGLGLGAADLVGIVTMPVYLDVTPNTRELRHFGRVFCLEVKWAGKAPTEDQIVWLRVVRSLGGFASVVTSIDDAVFAVARCRLGESE